MDKNTVDYYSANADEVADRYDSFTGGVSSFFREAFPMPESRILDVGCGSGRDLHTLRKRDYSAEGVDACREFIQYIKENKHDLRDHVRQDSLPDLKSVSDDSYDGIICVAVLQHLPEEQIFDAAFTLRRILRKNGRLLVSIPLHDATINPETKRDKTNRLFNGIKPEELHLLLERLGFVLIKRQDSSDSLARGHRRWATLILELRHETGERPVDTIEAILNKDAKVATYKLALFRAFADIATTNYRQAEWIDDGRVKIRTELLAEKWICYYWPLVEADIKQTTGSPIAFRKQLEELIRLYSGRGGLSAFTVDYRSNKLSPEAEKAVKKALSKLKSTIWNQPVRYAGGGDDFSVLQYDKKDQSVLVGHDIWHELSLTGHWIQDACILRWAELSAKIADNRIKTSQVIDCLLTVPVQNREVDAVKSFYDKMSPKECAWSGKKLKQKYHLDHAIPFCLWRNNDLWNLLPSHEEENKKKKDKLPDTPIIKARKDCIIHYWELIKTAFPARFEYESEKLTGSRFMKENWKNTLFAAFSEAIEITAIQRGVERWQPANFAATGTEGISFSSSPAPELKVGEDTTPYMSRSSRIIKIVSGGQTGADRGGLDAAIELDVPHGGWCPKGRLAEDGPIPVKYNQREMTSKNYVKRTEQNVIDSSATLIFSKLPLTGGSKKTAEFADKHARPCLCVSTDLSVNEAVATTLNWLNEMRNPEIVLNVAGSRESKAKGLQDWVRTVMIAVIRELNELPEAADTILLNFYPELEVACGAFRNGLTEYEAESIPVPNPHGNLSRDRHFVARATGDSMDGGNTPIKDGDLLLLELNEGGSISNQIFAVEYTDESGNTSYSLKRITKENGNYLLVSSNKNYTPIPVNPDNMSPFARFKERL